MSESSHRRQRNHRDNLLPHIPGGTKLTGQAALPVVRKAPTRHWIQLDPLAVRVAKLWVVDGAHDDRAIAGTAVWAAAAAQRGQIVLDPVEELVHGGHRLGTGVLKHRHHALI